MQTYVKFDKEQHMALLMSEATTSLRHVLVAAHFYPSSSMFSASRIELETGLSPPVKYFTDRSKAVLLLWILYVLFFCLVFAVSLCASVYM